MKRMLVVAMMAMSGAASAQAVGDKSFTIYLNWSQPTYLHQNLSNGHVCVKQYRNAQGQATATCEPTSYDAPANYAIYVYRTTTMSGPWGSCLWNVAGNPAGYGTTAWASLGNVLPQASNGCGTAATGTVKIEYALASDPSRTVLGSSTHTFTFQ